MNAINLKTAEKGDKFKTRGGNTVTVVHTDNTCMPVLCDNRLWYHENGRCFENHEDCEDIISMVEKCQGKVLGRNLTKGDIGKRFKRRDGTIVTMNNWTPHDEKMTARFFEGDWFGWYSKDGRKFGRDRELDIVSEVVEEEAFVIKQGFYKDSKGGKAEVVGKDALGNWCGRDSDGDYGCWTDVGEGVGVNPIKGSWNEPKRIKGTAIIYDDGDVRFVAEGRKDIYLNRGRIASVEIDVNEGHGLNGEGE